MTTTYTTTDKVSNRIQGELAKAIDLDADSGVSQANKDRVQVADTSPFTAGDSVRITDDTEKTGEDKIVDSVVVDDYVKLTTDMTKDYTTTLNGKIQIQSMFSKRSRPNRAHVEDLINEAEDYIDDQTHHAWRTRTVTKEYHTLKVRYYQWAGIPIPLYHRTIYDLDTLEGDKLEVWDGTDWIDWVVTRTESRKNDFWINYEQGILFLRIWYVPFPQDAVRITYRYGETTIPKDIQEAATKLAAADVLDEENFVAAVPSGDLNIVSVTTKQTQWRKRAAEIVDNRREILKPIP